MCPTRCSTLLPNSQKVLKNLSRSPEWLKFCFINCCKSIYDLVLVQLVCFLNCSSNLQMFGDGIQLRPMSSGRCEARVRLVQQHARTELVQHSGTMQRRRKLAWQRWTVSGPSHHKGSTDWNYNLLIKFLGSFFFLDLVNDSRCVQQELPLESFIWIGCSLDLCVATGSVMSAGVYH